MASVLGVALNNVFNVIHLKGKIKFQFTGLSIVKHLRFIITLFASALAIEIYTLADITMLTKMTDKANVGYFSNAVNGVKTIKELIVAICAVFLPRLSFYYANDQKIEFKNLAQKGIKILLFFSVPAAVGCFLLADKIVILLFGKAFVPAILTVRILTVSIITIGLSNFIGYQILVVVGKEKRMLFISVIGAVLNVILNLFLIPLYAHNGAAYASAFTELLVCFLYCYSFYKYIRIDNFLNYFTSIMIAVISMGICVELIGYINLPIIIECLISVFIGGLVYIGIGVLLKNEIAIMIIEKFRPLLKRAEILS